MRKLTPVLLTVMIASFVAIVYLRSDGASATAHATTSPTGAKLASATPVKPEPLARPLRTVALGWELLAPGVLASDAYKAKKLEATFGNAATVQELEAALAKGGADATGADIAIMPLSSFVTSYERLRALDPEIIFVVGWSRGREVVYANVPPAPGKLPATTKLAAAPGEPETFLALFLLDLAGMPASRVELATPGAQAPFAAARRAAAKTTGKLLLTSADTPRLMPIVAVAPRGLVQARARELETWLRAWLDGATKLGADVPAAARLVATQPGAPAVIGIIEALGQVELASLRDNAIVTGLSGRGAITLDELFMTTWRIWRDANVVTTAAPDTAPLDTALIAALIRSDPRAIDTAARPVTAPAAPRDVLLVVTAPATNDVDAWVARLGFVAGVFERMPLRITVKDAKLATQIVDRTRERFNLRADQISIAKRPGKGAIEVLSR